MKRSTQGLIAEAVVVNAIITIWGLLEPSQKDLRMPLWFAFMLLLGAIADRFLYNRI